MLVRLVGGRSGRPIAPQCFDQVEGNHDIGLDEVAQAVNGAVHMAFGREVDHRTRAVLGRQAAYQCAVADVALHDWLVTGDQPVKDEIGADETCAASDKKGQGLIKLRAPSRKFWSLLRRSSKEDQGLLLHPSTKHIKYLLVRFDFFDRWKL